MVSSFIVIVFVFYFIFRSVINVPFSFFFRNGTVEAELNERKCKFVLFFCFLFFSFQGPSLTLPFLFFFSEPGRTDKIYRTDRSYRSGPISVLLKSVLGPVLGLNRGPVSPDRTVNIANSIDFNQHYNKSNSG